MKKYILSQSTVVEDALKAYENGEITKQKFTRIKGEETKRHNNIAIYEAQLEFLEMQIYQTYAIVDACRNRLEYVQLPKKPKQRYNPRKLNSRKAKRSRNNPSANSFRNYTHWQSLMEKRGLGALWDKDKFYSICADRGFGSKINVIAHVAAVLDTGQRQVKFLLERGNFTWGQVLTLGASLEMTPKEFCDTFMSGYFVEQGEGHFVASFDNIPDDMTNTFKEVGTGTEQE